MREMKKLLAVGLIALISSLGLANTTAENVNLLSKYMGPVASKAGLGDLVNRTGNLLVAKYSYAVQGGTTVSDIRLLTDLTNPKSYATLPDNAIIRNAWIDVLTAPVGSASEKVQFNAQTPADILAATLD